jgi:Tfp pilus assembly protein PilV
MMPRVLRTLTKSGGFSLIEVVVAMFILTTIGLAIMAGYTNSIRSTKLIKQHTYAVNLARQAIESLKQFEEKDLNNVGWDAEIARINSALSGVEPETKVNYTIRAQRFNLPPVNGKDLLVGVRVIVTWPNTSTNVTFESQLLR